MAYFYKKIILPATLLFDKVNFLHIRRNVLHAILPFFIFLGFLVLYIHNLSASVYAGDVGDLITTATIGGVAHPPGYPLFTGIGFLLTHQPLFHGSPAFLVGLISAVSGALGILCYYLLTLYLTKNRFVALISSLILGLTFPYWFYSEIAEVFVLNAFFAIFLFLLAMLYRQTRRLSLLFLFSFFLGLSLTNHQTIVLLFPSLFLLVVPQALRTTIKRPLNLLWCLLFFLAGFIPYVYIFIASSTHPVINWDKVHDISSFLHLILRKDYGTFQAGVFGQPSWVQRLVILKVYGQYITSQLTIPVILLAFVGMTQFFKKDKVLFFSLIVSWMLSGPFFLVYAGFPLFNGFIFGAYERFILLSCVILLIPFGNGLLFATTYLARFLPKRKYALLFQSVFLLIPLLLFFYNFPKTNLSTFSIGNTYAFDFLSPLPKNAILLISGDTQIFNTWYVHYGLNSRPDVLLYNTGAAPLEDKLIAPQLSDIPQSKQSDALLAIVLRLQKTRPIFASSQLQPKKGEKLLWIPRGLSYELVQKNSPLPTEEEYKEQTTTIWKQLHPPRKEDLEKPVFHNVSIAEIPNFYADSLIAAGTFAYSHYKAVDTTLLLYKKARDIAPNDAHVYAALGVLYAGTSGNCHDIADNLTMSLSLDPFQATPYFILYNTYVKCFNAPREADLIGKQYSEIFRKDFQKEYKNFSTQMKL